MRFAEFHAGAVLEFGSYQISAADIVDFSRRFDPQPFHVDPVAAAQSRWGGLIASGFHTCAIAMRLVADHVLNGSESVGSPGIDVLKWLRPVRPGDTLRVRVEVQEAKPSAAGGTGVVRWRWCVLNQNAESVLDLTVTSLFDLRTNPSISDTGATHDKDGRSRLLDA